MKQGIISVGPVAAQARRRCKMKGLIALVVVVLLIGTVAGAVDDVMLTVKDIEREAKRASEENATRLQRQAIIDALKGQKLLFQGTVMDVAAGMKGKAIIELRYIRHPFLVEVVTYLPTEQVAELKKGDHLTVIGIIEHIGQFNAAAARIQLAEATIKK